MRTVTSVTITPPLAVQTLAVPLLREYTYDFPRRLPAHISVLYPFVDVAELSAACRTLRQLCAEVPPFNLTVEEYGSFPGVMYMGVRKNPALESLAQQIQLAFPDCIPYGGMFADEPVPPHITVGVFNSKSKQRAAKRPSYPPQTFKVDRLHVSVGTDDHIVPWLVYDVVTLGSS